MLPDKYFAAPSHIIEHKDHPMEGIPYAYENTGAA
jgi:hypothetical protein